ncbi:MAG: amidohydrolase, partial [Flammeovirgaceae bacterium]
MKKLIAILLCCSLALSSYAQGKLEKLKAEVAKEVEGNAALGQQINDMLFSFSELGFQEVETFNYLTSLLEKNGFKIQIGIAGVPTAWVAIWGSG